MINCQPAAGLKTFTTSLLWKELESMTNTKLNLPVICRWSLATLCLTSHRWYLRKLCIPRSDASDRKVSPWPTLFACMRFYKINTNIKMYSRYPPLWRSMKEFTMHKRVAYVRLDRWVCYMTAWIALTMQTMYNKNLRPVNVSPTCWNNSCLSWEQYAHIGNGTLLKYISSRACLS